MKAMILAAGRGERMRPLTDTTPKPLLQVNGKALIEYHIESLKKAGITEIIINTAWLGEKISAHLGDGARYGVTLRYSREETALETAGGISNALPLLGDEPFIIVNADVWTDFDFSLLKSQDLGGDLAKLVLVKTPDYLPGDFCLDGTRIKLKPSSPGNESQSQGPENVLTYSGIACYSPKMFKQLGREQHLALLPLLKKAIDENKLAGIEANIAWQDIGTPERLAQLNKP